ncbi:hypothetical protein QTP88_019598 [Uroleucon formosanum]
MRTMLTGMVAALPVVVACCVRVRACVHADYSTRCVYTRSLARRFEVLRKIKKKSDSPVLSVRLQRARTNNLGQIWHLCYGANIVFTTTSSLLVFNGQFPYQVRGLRLPAWKTFGCGPLNNHTLDNNNNDIITITTNWLADLQRRRRDQQLCSPQCIFYYYYYFGSRDRSSNVVGSLRLEEVVAVAADDDDLAVVVVVVVVVVVALAEERETPSTAGDQTVQQQQSRTSYRS